jgi:hypothetical protein
MIGWLRSRRNGMGHLAAGVALFTCASGSIGATNESGTTQTRDESIVGGAVVALVDKDWAELQSVCKSVSPRFDDDTVKASLALASALASVRQGGHAEALEKSDAATKSYPRMQEGVRTAFRRLSEACGRVSPGESGGRQPANMTAVELDLLERYVLRLMVRISEKVDGVGGVIALPYRGRYRDDEACMSKLRELRMVAIEASKENRQRLGLGTEETRRALVRFRDWAVECPAGAETRQLDIEGDSIAIIEVSPQLFIGGVFRLSSVIRHELTHAWQQPVRDRSVPLWLEEGCADWVAGESVRQVPMLLSLLGAKPSEDLHGGVMRALKSVVPEGDESFEMRAYAQLSGDLMWQVFEERLGEKGTAKLARAVLAGRGTDGAFEDVFGPEWRRIVQESTVVVQERMRATMSEAREYWKGRERHLAGEWEPAVQGLQGYVRSHPQGAFVARALLEIACSRFNNGDVQGAGETMGLVRESWQDTYNSAQSLYLRLRMAAAVGRWGDVASLAESFRRDWWMVAESTLEEVAHWEKTARWIISRRQVGIR